MYYSWWSAVSLRIQILPFFIDFTCGQIKGLFFFSFFLETFAPSGIRRNLSQKPPLTTFLISFIWTGSQADASVSPWLRGWGHFIWLPPNRIYLWSWERSQWSLPQIHKVRGERKGEVKCWLSGSTSSTSEKEFWWVLPPTCLFFECLVCATTLLGNLASAYTWALPMPMDIGIPLEAWTN